MDATSVRLHPAEIPSYLPILDRYKTKELLFRILFLIGQEGLSTRSDIALAMGLDMSTQRANRTSSQRISRACEILQKNLGFIEQIESKELYRIKIFHLIKLTDTGISFCQNTWGWNVLMSDWDKLIAWHSGEDHKAHNAMVLNFAFHARLRGWDAIVTPRDMRENCDPDVLILKEDQMFYIEFERKAFKTEHKSRKWANQYKAQKRITACYSTARAAYHAAGSFVVMGYSKFNLTSLQYLQKTAYNQPDGHPGRLWQFTSEEILNHG
ncbi:MAG: hypothetical protein RBT34_08810 [Anaerolineaceae bacterium]|jgi:hypothetical protein|nr:hypothetical protein [Anaerolineaceae bacterium]MDY0280580.1 hypothetical protein [Salinivirgaceae bacterium]